MSETFQEAKTLVNSGEDDSIGSLKSLGGSNLANSVKQIFINHPLYKHFNKLYIKHSEANNHNALIQENIWPILTGETLIGDDKINYRSNSFYYIDDKFLTDYNDFTSLNPTDNNYSYTFFHLGHKLSGHQTIIHGGLLATILDEITCRLAFQNFHSKKGVTANLNINYKQPCFINTYIMIKCEVVKKLGRKCFVKGYVYKLNLDDEKYKSNIDLTSIETKQNLLSECECLVIEPKWVSELKNTET